MSGWQNRQAVYALDLTGTQQLVLLGLVEHADDEGRNAFPSIERLAWLARCSVRTVQRTLNQFLKWGTISSRTARVGGRGKRTVYDLHLDQGSRRHPFSPAKGRHHDRVYAEKTPSSTTLKGDTGDINPVTGDGPLKDLPRELIHELPKRGCARELAGGARTRPLEDTKPEVTRYHSGENSVNELDVAYEAIPETERETWLQRADRALEAAGMPEWMRIAPTVKEMALRLWVGGTIPALASG